LKEKLSTTIDEPLLQFLDSLPGKTRSEKLERVLSKFKQVEEERQLRKQLSEQVEENDEQMERQAWERTVAEAMWTE
jgi:sugar diacid utilization regulator